MEASREDILKALEQVGDENAMPYVEKLAAASSDGRVLEAARSCLDYLFQTRIKNNVGRILLRPFLADQSALELTRTAPPPSSSKKSR